MQADRGGTLTMPNMSNEKTKMPELDWDVRINNFDEVALGYTQEQAISEAARCLKSIPQPRGTNDNHRRSGG